MLQIWNLQNFNQQYVKFSFIQKRTSGTYLSLCYLHMTKISLFLYEIPRVIHPSDEYRNSPAILQKKCYIYGVFSHFIERPNYKTTFQSRSRVRKNLIQRDKNSRNLIRYWAYTPEAGSILSPPLQFFHQKDQELVNLWTKILQKTAK